MSDMENPTETATDQHPACIFCQILAGEMPSEKIMENERFIVIRDIAPDAPVDVLVIAKKHYATFEEALQAEPDFGAAWLATASQAAHLTNIADNYQIHANVGLKVQKVHHLHLHVMGGWAEGEIPQ